MKWCTKRNTAFLLIVILLTSFMAACSKPTKTTGHLSLLALNGPTGMGLAKIAENDLSDVEYQLSNASAPDNLIASALKGEADIIAMPSNMASVLWHKSEKNYQVLAINTLGVLYIMEKGDTVHSLQDLKGQTVLASGKGATPEFAFRYLLQENGLNPDRDITINWKSEHAEVVSGLAAGESTLALLPQPFVTVASGKIDHLRLALDLNQAWQETNPTSKFAMGVVVAEKDFVEKNGELIQQFLNDYQQSVDFVNDYPDEASVLIAKHKILENAAIAEKAIPYCHITCITGQEMKEALAGYLDVLYQFEQKSVGGSLPDDGFYYIP